jgi:hypothetical protein
VVTPGIVFMTSTNLERKKDEGLAGRLAMIKRRLETQDTRPDSMTSHAKVNRSNKRARD